MSLNEKKVFIIKMRAIKRAFVICVRFVGGEKRKGSVHIIFGSHASMS